jgi:hypothetical protein
MGKVMSIYTPNVLNTHFKNADGTPRAQAPLLLFASENTQRSIALGTPNYSSSQANGVTVGLCPAGQDAQSVLTIASLSWAPYRLGRKQQQLDVLPIRGILGSAGAAPQRDRRLQRR